MIGVIALMAFAVGTHLGDCPGRNAADFGYKGPVSSVHVEIAYIVMENGEAKEIDRHLKEIRLYDERGRATEDLGYDDDGTLAFRRVYERGPDGNLRETRVYRTDGTLWDRDVYSRDPITGICFVDSPDGSGGKGVRVKGYRCNLDGTLAEEFSYRSNGSLIFRTRHGYDLGGRLIRSETYSPDVPNDQRLIGDHLVRWRIYNWDASGRLLRTRDYESSQHGLVRDATYTYKFDEMGNVVKTTESWLEKKDGKETYEPAMVFYNTFTYRR